MIISPPFLPQGHATEEAFLTASMCGVSDGFYPLTTSLQWHNGVHLQAPMHENQYLDVRAIADGEVVHVVTPDTAPSADATHPQNHPAYGAGPEWTDKGMLILRHTTEIGAQEDTPTVVTFFSVYLHLQSLAALTVPKVSGKKGETEKRPLRVGDRIYRKDVLGRAGQIYGQRGRIHFEVCSDETNLQRLLGSRRPLSWQSDIAPPTTDGRTDALFGSTCVYLPATAPVRTGQPTSHLQAPAGQGAGNTDILGIPLWVDIRYSLGDSTITTFYATDHPEQGVRAGARIGELSAKGAEYAMFTEAQSRHAGAVRESSALMPATGPALSSPSGWYGLLRWARKLGPDPLPPNAAHWRQIATPQGPRWADLNTAGSFKFSDADFPIFKGWQCINDDERHDDQRCDSPRLRTMLLTGIETSQRAEILKDTAKLAGRLRDSKTIQPLMKKLICRFPTEFDRSNIDSRYGWYRESPGFMEDSTKWERLKAHITALTHADLPQAYKDAQWHFHPAEFIRMFRQCGWLSRSELVQMLPSHAVRTGKHEPSGKVGALWEAVQTNIERRNVVIELHRTPMNRMMRKHGITTPLRQASFLGNAMQETSWLSSFQEFGPNGRWYTPWHGRGYLQLTHPSNYFGYWEWQGKIFATSIKTALVNAEQTEGSKKPELRNRKAMADENFSQLTAAVLQWRSAVHGGGADVNFSEQLLAPSDSAGYYWLRSGMAAHADQPHLLERVTVSTVDDTGSRIFYRSPAFWRASAAVNLPSVVNTTYSRALNGFNSRCSGYGSALATLSEMRFPDTDARHVLEFPEGYNKRPM